MPADTSGVTTDAQGHGSPPPSGQGAPSADPGQPVPSAPAGGQPRSAGDGNGSSTTSRGPQSDGATAVIGGIYQQNQQVARNQTPIMGDLPIVGYLFRSKTVRDDNTELIVFITPRIVKT